MKSVKVAYLIVVRSFPGLLKQIEYDRALTRELDGIEWDHFTFLDKVEEGDATLQLPALYRGVFGRKLFAWLWLLRNASRYDYVIVRHMEFDPFALIFAWFVRNRILVHHSKEVLELRLVRGGWKGRAASMLERFSGRVAVRTARALLGVTQEVCDYQRSFRGLSPDVPICLFANGVIVDTIPLLGDARSEGIVDIGFMCGSFAQWHGLDILLDKLLAYADSDAPYPIKMHLIGRLSDEQTAHVDKVNAVWGFEIVRMYGRLKQTEYRAILEKCHIGIGSLAMHRIEMVEGTTLKVREMLAMGLPLYSGHVDTAVPRDFRYYFIGKADIPEIVSFAKTVGSVPREKVREAARQYIDKRIWIEKLADFLRDLNRSDAD